MHSPKRKGAFKDESNNTLPSRWRSLPLCKYICKSPEFSLDSTQNDNRQDAFSFRCKEDTTKRSLGRNILFLAKSKVKLVNFVSLPTDLISFGLVCRVFSPRNQSRGSDKNLCANCTSRKPKIVSNDDVCCSRAQNFAVADV